MLLFFLIIGILLGLCRGGRLKNAALYPLRNPALPIIAFAVKEFLPSLFHFLSVNNKVFDAIPVLLCYGCLFLFVKCNWKQGVWPLFFGLGTLLNFIVIFLNQWRMPVSVFLLTQERYADISMQLRNHEIPQYALQTAATKLPFLGDIIKIELFSKLFGFASIGDFLLSIGVSILAYRILVFRK